ncbi:receptor kinase-like protein Xa21 isoform X1 [Carex rostrata]
MQGLHLLLLICLFSFHLPSNNFATNETDKFALLSFKSLMSNDSFEALSSWNDSLHYCQWQGIRCSNRHPDRVTSLSLGSLSLSGRICPSLANLTFLKSLNLSFNQLTGNIPEELGHLSRLQMLRLSVNNLDGNIPSTLGNCSNLKFLGLRNNNLQGTIPPQFGFLKLLEILSVGTNNLTESIPSTLGNLTHLSELYLYENNLDGNIPAELGHLSRLQILRLEMNKLDGNIPAELGHLSRLQILNLGVNNLDGNIPSTLGNCSNLEYIFMGSNNLQGSIPPQFGFLEQLKELYLYTNNFTESIPSTLGNLTHLSALYLYENNLDGFIPPTLGQLKALKNLSLHANNLSGKIPHSIYNLSALVDLGLSINQLDGNLPSNFCDAFQSLQILLLYENQLNGQIPISISNCSALIMIDLSYNNFTGTIPYSIGTLQNLYWLNLQANQIKATGGDWRFFDSLINCTFLRLLDLGDNQLHGMLPHSIANLSTSLKYLRLDRNPISGNIPAEVEKLTNLSMLELGQTFIEGTIPKEIGNLWNLEGIYLYENMLSGEIPSTLGNLTKMVLLYLDNNAFTGSIPEELSNMQVLSTLDLSNNRLVGLIPKELFNLHSLSIILDLSNNYLNGSLPPEIGHLNNVEGVYLSNNKLSGQIPSTIGGCQLLQVLHLEGNQLNGSIPFSFSNMIGLQYLDISNNTLSGTVPEFVGQMKLGHLNISFNNFEGELPKDGIFRNASAVDIRGNSKLCGGVPEMHLPKCVLDNQKKNHSSKIITVIICCIAGIILMCITMLFIARFCCKKESQNNPQPFVAKNSEYHKVSYNDILRATDHFSLENLIGRGTFGAVYKAPMNFENVTMVAVKVLNLNQHGASRSFFSECEVLRKVRHKNLNKVLSACSSIDHHGNDFKALIFEFMPNGSLETWLHTDTCTNRQFRSLSLIQRLNIAIDVATALDYLHNHGPTPIIHCDLKPSNVLLDDDMTAQVGDFGLARFLVQPDSMSSLLTASTAGLRGSIGYIPPEYGMGGQASVEGDAYSYGIFLLEMFTGISPTDGRFRDGLSLHMHVEMAFFHRVTEIIDHKLFAVNDGEDNANVTENVHDCLVSVIRCGLLCSKFSPKLRIGIAQVVKELNWARVKLLS